MMGTGEWMAQSAQLAACHRRGATVFGWRAASARRWAVGGCEAATGPAHTWVSLSRISRTAAAASCGACVAPAIASTGPVSARIMGAGLTHMPRHWNADRRPNSSAIRAYTSATRACAASPSACAASPPPMRARALRGAWWAGMRCMTAHAPRHGAAASSALCVCKSCTCFTKANMLLQTRAGHGQLTPPAACRVKHVTRRPCTHHAACAPHELKAGCLRKQLQLRRDVSLPHLRRLPHSCERLCAVRRHHADPAGQVRRRWRAERGRQRRRRRHCGAGCALRVSHWACSDLQGVRPFSCCSAGAGANDTAAGAAAAVAMLQWACVH